MKPPEAMSAGPLAREPEAAASPSPPRVRAFELDALRGLAVLMMMLHHFAFDLRYFLGLDVFAFQERPWFQYLLRPLFVAVFLTVSGICCSFSRDNLKRGLRMLAAAAVLTAVTTAASLLTHTDLFIFFNVIHLIAVGTLLYARMERRDARRVPGKREARLAVSAILSVSLIFLGGVIERFGPVSNDWLLPLGWATDTALRVMSDYMPLLPWLGFFFSGAVLGLLLYRERRSLFPGAPRRLVRAAAPLGFLGRHALVFYLLHQPVILGILILLRRAGVI